MGLVRAVLICAVLGLTTGKLHGSGSSAKVTLVKAVGSTVVFNTARDPGAYTVLSWIFNNYLTVVSVSGGVNSTDPEYVDRITLLADGSLELRNLTLGDQGDYTVTITSTGAPEFISVFSLNVQEPVSGVRLTASATDLIEGMSVNLFCAASGSNMNVIWYNQSQPRSMSLERLGFLRSFVVDRHDTGPFECEVFNEISRMRSEEVRLTISYGPDMTLTTVPLQYKYSEGSNVTLTCTVDSRPEAEITWTHDQSQLPFYGTELVLNDIKYSQRGMYLCTAYNPTSGKRSAILKDISVESSLPDPTPTPSWGPSLKSFHMCSFCFWICCWFGLFLS